MWMSCLALRHYRPLLRLEVKDLQINGEAIKRGDEAAVGGPARGVHAFRSGEGAYLVAGEI